jgi:hypothetical protein
MRKKGGSFTMLTKLIILLSLLLATSGIVAAQRSLTNADLERYREARLRAERDYRQNYDKLGMPSPEELARRREDHIFQTSQVAARLRETRLEQERLEFERYRAAREAQIITAYQQPVTSQFYGESFIYPYGGYFNGGRHGRYRGYQVLPQQGYFAGGQFWPTGPATRVRPIIRIGGGGGHGRRR